MNSAIDPENTDTDNDGRAIQAVKRYRKWSFHGAICIESLSYLRNPEYVNPAMYRYISIILTSIIALYISAPAESETPKAIVIYDKQKMADTCGDCRNNAAYQDFCTGYLIGIVEAKSRDYKERDRILLSCALPMRYKVFEKFREIASQRDDLSKPSIILMKSIKVICE